MNTTAVSTNTALPQRPSLIASMAERYNLEPTIFQNTIKATCFPKGAAVSNEQFAAFLMVAKEYDLNPLTKEIYAFPQNGGIVPIVSIDGWMNLMNSHPQMDGIEFEERMNDAGKVTAITCKIYRKDRKHPVTVTEYMEECVRKSEPWQKWPVRMLRHKAAIQCARVAFGFAGIVEEDEWERMKDVTPVSANVEKFVDEEIAHEVLPAAKQSDPVKTVPVTVIDNMPVSDVPLYSLSDIYGEVYRTGVPAEEALQEITSQIASYESESVRKAYIDANRGAITALNINTQPAKAA